MTASSISAASPAAFTPSTQAAKSGFRVWPAILIVVLQWLIIFIPGMIAPLTPTQFFGWFLGPIIGALALMIWWLFGTGLSRADRWLIIATYIVAAVITRIVSHTTIAGFGVMLFALPIANTAWAAWLWVSQSLNWSSRRLSLIAVLCLSFGWIALVRMEGTDGKIAAKFVFRWAPTAEDQYLAELAAGKAPEAKSVPKPADPAQPLALTDGDWPAFRGANRDGRLSGVKINADWKNHPPKQLWKRHVGPGWSSFSVIGERVFTQEQRGDNEIVVCYDAGTGAELWTHADAVRFKETMAGPGPRATPTFFEGRLYVQGATGKLNCLDALTGKAVWARDVAVDSGAPLPMWGFSSSPLIVNGVLGVFTGAPGGKSVLGYYVANGDLKWSAGEGQLSYCSLQPAKLCGVDQALIATDRGMESYAMDSGTVLWKYNWPVPGMNRVVQPAVVSDTDVLIGTGFGNGTRRVRLKHEGDKWTTEEIWKSHAIKPYYNDMVIQRDCLYGFDGNYFTCVKLDDGKSAWRVEGYGNGQVLLLADQDLLLVLSEKGEAALVDASPAAHVQRGIFQAIEGKTWNHPVIAHGKLFVRNGEEAACYDVSEPTGAK